MMTIKAVLFDKDGTLIEVNGTWIPTYRAMLGKLFSADQQKVDELLISAGYDKVSNSFKAGSILAGGTMRQLVDVWWPGLSESQARAQIDMIERDFAHEARVYLQPLLPLPPVFDALQAMGLVLGVATNDNFKSATAHINELGVGHYFREIIAADTVAIAKPSGDMIRKFAKTTGFHPSEIAMVGDNSHDIEEARNGGAGLAVGVLTGNAGPEHISHLADYTLESIAELPALLQSL
jgi:phosphoglycolate phosphatase